MPSVPNRRKVINRETRTRSCPDLNKGIATPDTGAPAERPDFGRQVMHGGSFTPAPLTGHRIADRFASLEGAAMGSLLDDLRYGFRILVKAPGFTTAVVIVLALGIGANTAIFSLMHAVLLEALPVTRPQELVLIQTWTREAGLHAEF